MTTIIELENDWKFNILVSDLFSPQVPAKKFNYTPTGFCEWNIRRKTVAIKSLEAITIDVFPIWIKRLVTFNFSNINLVYVALGSSGRCSCVQSHKEFIATKKKTPRGWQYNRKGENNAPFQETSHMYIVNMVLLKSAIIHSPGNCF